MRTANLLLALAASWLATAIAPAHAETRSHYQSFQVKNCNTPVLLCELEFPTVASNRRIELERANCQVSMAPGQQVFAQLLLLPPPTIEVTFIPGAVADTGSTGFAHFDQETDLFVSAGRHVTFKVTMPEAGPIRIRCSLFGTWVNLP